MPRFDIRVSYLDITYHTVAEAASLESLPVDAAKALALRIYQITGAAQHKPDDPALVNKVREIVGVAPKTREQVNEEKAKKVKGK